MGPARFVDETATAGVDQTYDGGPTAFVGGGVAVFDCNGDGRDELYLAGGSHPAALYRNDSPIGGTLRFSQLRDPATDLTGVNGAYPLDIDGDGIVDLAVLRVGGADLLRGLGDCRFENADRTWGFDGGRGWSTAFSATWEGSATLPTLALGNYVRLDTTGQPGDSCSDNALYRPDAGGLGYATPAALSPGYCTLSMLFSDWDRSGRRDLRVTNDRHYYVDGEDQLWRVAPGETPRLYTQDDGWVAMQIWGMGIASYDLTGDGYPEVFLTSQGDNRLQTLAAGPSQPTYRDIALKRGVTAAQPFTGGDVLPSTAWHPEFEDVNNDGYMDLFISKGNVSAMPDYAARDPSNLLLGQPDGTFTEAAGAAGTVTFARGRGAALADLNLDGLLDLVQVNLGAPVMLWRNVGSGDSAGPGPMGGWLALRVHQPAPNRDAIGGWLEVRVGDTTTRRELTVGGGHIGGQLGWIHVGLGSATAADVRVQWPDGEVGPWIRVPANEFADIERGAAEAQAWQPPAN
ncbi:MAG: CRTAC1 family protein [Chloroflexi bacterium]|nr:CRTAC1 family protein [Chloroflexota bacterium]